MSNETRSIIYKEASGSIASFNTNVVGDCRSVVADINPVQDLHGQDSPYPAGGGKNKFNQNGIQNRSTTTNSIVNNNGVITVTIGESSTYNGISTTQTLRSLAPYLVAGQTYTLTVNTNGVAQIYLLDVKWESGQSMALTDELLDKNVWLYANGKGTTATISGIQIEQGTTATAFAPYENECPISGHTSVTVPRTGRNLFDYRTVQSASRYGITLTNNNDGTFTANGTATNAVYFDLFNTQFSANPLPYGTYTLSGCPSGAGRDTYSMYVRPTYSNDYGNGVTFTNRVMGGSLFIQGGQTLDNVVFRPQIEIGSTKHDFEPYTGQTITIPFGQTVYGCKVDVVSGVLTVDRAMVDLGTAIFSLWNTSSTRDCYSTTDFPIKPRSNASEDIPAVSSIFAPTNYMATWRPWQMSYTNNQGQIVFITPHGEYADSNAFKTAVNGVQFCYELATPIEITLTPQQLATLLGDNNVWADTGDITVKYPYKDTSRNMDFLRLLFVESMWGGEEE